jgi:hypothetical protein
MATTTQPGDKKLFSPLAVLAHSLLFTPIFGGMLVMLNWQRMGQASRGWLEWASAIAVLGVVGLVGRAQSDRVLLLGLIAAVAGISASWLSEQQQLFASHKHSGGTAATSIPFTVGGVLLLGLLLAAYVFRSR